MSRFAPTPLLSLSRIAGLLTLLACCLAIPALAQTQIQSVTTTALTPAPETYTVNSKTVNHGVTVSGKPPQDLRLETLTTGTGGSAVTFLRVEGPSRVEIRRNDTGPSGQGYPFSNKTTVWYEGDCTVAGCGAGTTANIVTSRVLTEAEAINGILNRGSDNTFDNARPVAAANNNLERIDFIFGSGFAPGTVEVTEGGFPIFERSGGNDFQIAAITALDGNNDPSAYGPLVLVNNNTGPILAGGIVQYIDTQDNNGTTALEPLDEGSNQDVKGVFVSLADLGISVGQTIFGYSLFGPDVTSNPGTCTLVDFTNRTCFPASTTGGADIISGGAFFSSTGEFPVELTSFEPVLDGDAVTLTWETATETNNAGFEVQHAVGEAEFAVRTFVEGHGTTTQAQRYSHRLDGLEPGAHRFRLRQVDFDGAFEYSPEVEVFVGMPETFLLEAAYPNPFNPQTALRFGVQREQQVRVELYNANGQLIRTLFDGTAASGVMHAVTVDGSRLSSGTYLIRVAGETFAETQTVTLIK